MELHEIETRLTLLEHLVSILQHEKQSPDPSTELAIAVEQTIGVLRKWRLDKQDLFRNDDYSDYRDVIRTLPVLEKAFDAWKKKPKV